MSAEDRGRNAAVARREMVYRYHQQTKHRYEGYARGPEVLDWSDQPDVFRYFDGAESVELPLLAKDSLTLPYTALFKAVYTEPQPFDIPSLAALLELAFGLSAWKGMAGDRWALRCNPSSGNLHPTEVYLLIGGYDEVIPAGVYHYDSYRHQLTRRCALNDHDWCGVIVGLTSVHWREAWKYGERAYRYCQHDLGHALAALRLSGRCLNVSLHYLPDLSDELTAQVTGIDRIQDFEEDELETPGLLSLIDAWSPSGLPDMTKLIPLLQQGQWKGKAKRLGGRHFYQWSVIDEVSQACVRDTAEHSAETSDRDADGIYLSPDSDGGANNSFDSSLLATQIIKQRRSAQRFDGETGLSRERFLHMLNATLPQKGASPFDRWPWPVATHLLVFVHRVDGMQPGVYLFPRHGCALETIKSAMRSELAWESSTEWPGLYLLAAANAQKATKKLSCYQGIAGNGAFTLGMLSEFDKTLEQGAWHYRRLFWECGFIGQILYLEAEASGLRGTGIGCFFDDEVHQLLGLQDTRFQSLYHFTAGYPVEDNRLETLPAYAHLQR